MIKASCSIKLSSKEKQLRKLNCYSIIKLTSLILIGIIWYGGWFTPNGEGFTIYMTKEDLKPAQIPILSHVDIAEKPIIAKDDIITYNANTHEITLTANAFNRISKLDIPVNGKSFIVCVDKKAIYCGAFWTPISSISFDGVIIYKPLNSQESKVIKLELGYPSPFFYGGDDPRNNEEIMKSLKEAGKLSIEPSYKTVETLPHSMKGYELYSWQENGQWHFTLITGTNRHKTLEEITSKINIISQGGWVKIHVVGVDEIKSVLSRLPQSEYILWLSKPRIEQSKLKEIVITLPKETTINTIKERTDQRGLNLVIQPSS